MRRRMIGSSPVLARVRRERERAAARLLRAGVRADHGLGAGRRGRTGRFSPPAWSRCWRPTWSCCGPRSRRWRNSPRRCATTTRSAPGVARRCDRRPERRGAGADVQRHARPARGRAPRQRTAGVDGPGGGAPADRARAARRSRPDADRRDAADRRARRAASPTSCAISSRSCARPHGTAPRRFAGSRAGCGPTRLEELGLHSALAALSSGFERHARIPVTRRLAHDVDAGARGGARHLPRRPGGTDQRGAPCRRRARDRRPPARRRHDGPASSATTAVACRRARSIPHRASAGCVSVRCSSAARCRSRASAGGGTVVRLSVPRAALR